MKQRESWGKWKVSVTIVAIISIYLGGHFFFFNERVIPIVDKATHVTIISVEKRVDENGNNMAIDLTNSQEQQIKACLMRYKKTKTWRKSGGFSGRDYDILIKYSESGDDPQVCNMLIGVKNEILSDIRSPVYRICEPESLKKELETILNF